MSTKCELVCFGVKILNFVYFGVKKSGISVFLVSAENGAGVNKKTNITYDDTPLQSSSCSQMQLVVPLQCAVAAAAAAAAGDA